MESIYFVLSWLCHRTCPHCYDDRFRPYYGQQLHDVVEQSRCNVPLIIENLPDRMTCIDRADGSERRGRIIVAGGEVLLEAIREPVLYPALRKLRARYQNAGGVELIVQTTGDILSERFVQELVELGVDVISVSGMDEYHDGYDTEA